MIRYVLGFLFTPDEDRVVLLQKTHGPQNMAGKLNGIGGKIEPGEVPRIGVPLVDLDGHVRVASPQHGWISLADDGGDRGAPRTGPEHRDVHCSAWRVRGPPKPGRTLALPSVPRSSAYNRSAHKGHSGPNNGEQGAPEGGHERVERHDHGRLREAEHGRG